MMKIKEKYKCDKVVNPKYPLEKWFNNLIEKNEDDISLHDVCVMLRQSVFVETALSRCVIFLDDNPLSGDIYAGELLQVLLEKNKEYIRCNNSLFSKYINEVKVILDNPNSYMTNNCYELSESEVDDIKRIILELGIVTRAS